MSAVTTLASPPATKLVYDFREGNATLADLLGGKGANLAEMTRLGLPVPPGFTITTAACRAYLSDGHQPMGLAEEVAKHCADLERATGRRLGDPTDPLLVSVRSGGRFSMPGMMETVLDIGLNDASVLGLAERSQDPAFAWDSYRRLVQMYATTVYGMDGATFRGRLERARHEAGVDSEVELTVPVLQSVVADFKAAIRRERGHEFPQDPLHQLTGAIEAVFRSWNSERAATYRRRERIPADLGTAVTVMSMVYGNLGRSSGTGVAFTRDPATGARGLYGDYLVAAQGEDVVAGGHNTRPLADLEQLDPVSFAQLLGHMRTLERHYRDLCDIEFTIERGRLWMLQTRVGKRTPAAAFVLACQFADEGLITMDEALARVDGAELAQLMFPSLAPTAEHQVLATGVPASPGAAIGAAVFDRERACAWPGPVVLVRTETNPDDLPGMIAAQGVLTSRGGKTSHAAVVARGMGKPCVCGAQEVLVDERARAATIGSRVIREGELISVDGSTGRVYLGEVPVQDSPVVRHLEDAAAPGDDPVILAVDRLLQHADRARRLGVQANADTPADAARARRFGAEGIGLCRTEHMFLGPRRHLVERLVLATGPEQRSAALDHLGALQRSDFLQILREMDGRPVTVRLIDPPLHEFLPRVEELLERVVRAESGAGGPVAPEAEHDQQLLAAVRRIAEQNPMLGLRGVRLGLMIPGLVQMQARAVAQAAAELAGQGLDPRPEIMVPLVAAGRELELTRLAVQEVLDGVPGAPPIPIGTMVEVPRAALTAGEIAAQAEFFSFGTNDLTQMVWGMSRDDVESAFFGRYLDLGVFEVSPFESLDVAGVGRLVALAVQEGRARRPGLRIGVCGEHGGDPASIAFFHQVGLDYVSCSPFRVPVARLEAGRSAVRSASPALRGEAGTSR